MERTLIRFYDENDQSSLEGKRHFLVLDCSFEELSSDEFERMLLSVTGMKWQTYNSYMVGTADISEDELYWSEIMNYDMYEVCIDCSRVANKKYYDFPKIFRWWE